MFASDPHDLAVLPSDPPPPDSLVRALRDRRKEQLAWLVDLWQRDRVGFDLFAGEMVWNDPELANLLPHDAAMRAVRLCSRAAIDVYRRNRGAQA